MTPNPTEGKLTEALKPCPFCGGDNLDNDQDPETACYGVRCLDCEAQGKLFSGYIDGTQEWDTSIAKNRAARAWNTRLETLKAPAVTTGEGYHDDKEYYKDEPAPAPLSSEAVGKVRDALESFLAIGKRQSLNNPKYDGYFVSLGNALALLTPSPTAHPSSEAVERPKRTLSEVRREAIKMALRKWSNVSEENNGVAEENVMANLNALDALLTPSPSEKEKP